MNTRSAFHVSANRYPPLPAEHHTRRIWMELAQGFDEYHVLARGSRWGYSHTQEGKLHLHLVPALVPGSWIFFATSWALPLLVAKWRPSVLVAQCPVLGGLAGAFSSLVFRVPLLVELHGTHYFAPVRSGLIGRAEHVVYRMFSGLAFRAARRIRALSAGMATALQQMYGDHLRTKIVVIPTRVDLRVFKEVKQDYRLAGPVRIVTVGAVSPTKNHLALIRDLHASGLDFQLTVVGTGPLVQACKAEAGRLGISDRVTMAGALTHAELAALLPQQDLYVHYSLAEGLSRAILEAMAAGLPVVTAPVGFIGGVLEHAANSMLLAGSSAAALRDALVTLCASEETRRSLGHAARSTIEQRFDAQRVFSDYRDALTSLA